MKEEPLFPSLLLQKAPFDSLNEQKTSSTQRDERMREDVITIRERIWLI